VLIKIIPNVKVPELNTLSHVHSSETFVEYVTFHYGTRRTEDYKMFI